MLVVQLTARFLSYPENLELSSQQIDGISHSVFLIPQSIFTHFPQFCERLDSATYLQ